MGTVLTEGRHPGEFIMTEGPNQYSRDNLIIAESQSFEPGSLLIRVAIPLGVATLVTPAAGNVGNGVLTLASPAVSSSVKEGRYTLTITSPVANAGGFQVEGPDGKVIGTGTVGAAFNKAVKFTLADGATDFVVGDQIHIDVDASNLGFQHKAWNPNGPDAGEKPIAIAIYGAVTGVGETKEISAITRLAEINHNCVAWPAGATPAQISAALDALASSGIGIVAR